jgi:hypothetical protein
LHHVVTGVRTARQLLQTPASRQSRRGLDWTNFFIADIQIRFGTFVAFYLAGRAGAREALDWCSRAVASPACSGRFPAALADAVPWKRGLVGCGIVMICAGALILGIAPAFYLVFLAQILQGLSAERFEWHYTQNTAVGSIWPNPNSAFYRPSVWIAASPTSKSSSTRLPPGSKTAMQNTQRPIGTSQPPTRASNSSISTRQSD